MAKVWVDGETYEMNGSENLLHQCLSLGFDLPYFCWHPALGSVGACRQCAVKQYKDENDKKGRIVMACMTPASEGTRISIADSEAAVFRRSVIEGLMENHPHDCPVCDEGGECHLQDMTVMTGHDYRRYRFEKRTWRNQDLGPLVNHEMNRCIQCYRCVRYYRDYAGGHDLNSFALRNIVYFGRAEDGTLESEFSGNLVEICPTGVFTDKTRSRHYTRKWDMQWAPSICIHCGAGCNISAGERYATVRCVENRYNHEVNGYFLCDRGRFGYEFVNSPRRRRDPMWQGTTLSIEEAVVKLREVVRGGAVGIGSPRASLESNFALRKLVGPERFYAGVDDVEFQLARTMLSALRGAAPTPSLREIEEADAVLVLGEDINNSAPRYALAVRQSVRQASFRIAAKLKVPLWMDNGVRDAAQSTRSPLFVATPAPTRIDDIAARIFRGAPEDIARLGFAVAAALDPAASPVQDLQQDTGYLAGFIAEALRSAERPVIVSGPGLRSEAVVRAAAAVARALVAAGRPAQLAYTTPEPNTFGLAMMEPLPLSAALTSGAETVIVLENDLYRRAPAPAVDAFLGGAKHVVAVHYLENPTVEKAELFLPAGTFTESDGTLVSSEGRAQRFFQVFVPPAPILESWRWLGDPAWGNLDGVIAAMAAAMPQFARVPDAAPSADYRVAGGKFARAPHRFSGHTAMFANISVHEPKPPEDPDSALKFSFEGMRVQPPPALIPFFWAPRWNSIQSVNKFQEEVAGPLRGGVPGVRLIEPAGLPDGTAPVPPAFAPRDNEWRVVPLYHVFGSDELAHYAAAVASLIPEAFIALNPADASRLQLAEGAVASVCGHRAPVRIMPELPRGVAGIPVGIPPFTLPPPEWSAIARLP